MRLWRSPWVCLPLTLGCGSLRRDGGHLDLPQRLCSGVGRGDWVILAGIMIIRVSNYDVCLLLFLCQIYASSGKNEIPLPLLLRMNIQIVYLELLWDFANVT